MNTNLNETKRMNKIRIGKFISARGITSKNEISTQLQLSMPTTLQNVKELVAEGIVVESGQYQSTGGRKAKALSIAGDIGFVVGMDITNNHIALVLVNMKQEILQRERLRVPFEDSFDYYETLGSILWNFIEKAGVSGEKIGGLGISLPGIVNRKEKVLIRSHTLGVTNVSFKTLEHVLRLPFELENDANSAACAELMCETDNTVYLSLSNTVGGAVFFGNKLYLGENFRSGEFGHMVIKKDGRECYCGKKGCVDAYCAAKVLQELTNGNLDEFFEKLNKNDIKCQEAWNEYLEYLAVTITNLRMAFDCNVMVGGYVGGYLETYRMDLNKKLMKYNNFDLDTSYLKIGKYHLEAAAYGVTLKFVEGFFDALE